VHYSALPSQLITATCVSPDIEGLFQCLLGDSVDFVFHYPVEKQNELKVMPTDIWVLGSSWRSCSLDGRGQKDLSKDKELNDEVSREKQLEALFYQAKVGSSYQRTRAIFELTNKAPNNLEAMTDLLRQALIDESPNVRAQALSVWVKRKEEAAEGLVEQFLQDDAVEVRMMAVGLVTTKELLLFAMDDSDKRVQKFAKIKLEKLEKIN